MDESRKFFQVDRWAYVNIALAFLASLAFRLFIVEMPPFMDHASMSEWAATYLPTLQIESPLFQTIMVFFTIYMLLQGAVYVANNFRAYGCDPAFARMWVMFEAAMLAPIQYANLHAAASLEFYLLLFAFAQLLVLMLVFCERDRDLTLRERFNLIMLAGLANSLANGLITGTVLDPKHLLNTVVIGCGLAFAIAVVYTSLYGINWLFWKATGISLLVKAPSRAIRT
ncbi:TPA: hypothetical protein DF272_02660 [Candidatus Falkowbacteria bacterium]|nr:hypothetical protein [Candidatus Falkowbacteria bacterium]